MPAVILSNLNFYEEKKKGRTREGKREAQSVVFFSKSLMLLFILKMSHKEGHYRSNYN